MIEVNDRLQTVHCRHCDTTDAIPHRMHHRPDERLEFLEMYELHHSECESYGDVRKARANLRYRKEMKRQALLASRRPMPAWVM